MTVLFYFLAFTISFDNLLNMLLTKLVLSLYLFKLLACINKQNIVIFFTALLENKNTSRNACAIENMFLAAQSLGIGSCWINQLGTTCDDPEVREFITALGVPANHKVYGCVALGYPDSKIPIKEKKVKANTITIVR